MVVAAHRKTPNRQRELRERAAALVRERLGSGVICARCGATLVTYADKCDADLDQRCAGFNAIDREHMRAVKEVGLI